MVLVILLYHQSSMYHMQRRKFLMAFLALSALGFLGGFIAWWGIALIALILSAFFRLPFLGTVVFGFMGGAISYWIQLFYINSLNEDILVQKMNVLFPFNPTLVSILIGALLASLGAVCGKYTSDVLFGEVKKVKYRGKYK